tara:strand:- start:1101 stop:3401 length:2301 start_codon:yes stop_codon:yes gene_type:complete
MIKTLYRNYLRIFSIYPNLLINNFFANFILLTFFISGYFALSAEIGLITSLTILICQIFSGNLRSIIIADKNLKLADEMLVKRLILSIPIIIILISFIFKNDLSDISLALSISLVVILGWIFELILTKFEIKRNTKGSRLHLLLSVFFCLFILFFGLTGNLLYLKIVIYFYLIFLAFLILFLLRLNIKNFKFTKPGKNIFSDILKVNFISSISMSLSNFLFRYFLILFISKETAGILFACFMIGSFPGSLFNQIFGASIINKKISLKKIMYPTLILSLIFILYLYSKIPFNIFDIENYFIIHSRETIIYFTLLFSTVGLNIMIVALYLRQKNIFLSSARENYFIIDMFYSLSVILIIPIIYLLFDPNDFFYSLSFLISSILALIFYLSPKINFEKDVFLKFSLIIILIPFFVIFYDRNLDFYFLNNELLNSFSLENSKNRLANFLFFLPFLLYFVLKKITNKIIPITFVLTAIFCIININLFRNEITIYTHLNLVQILIPMTFLILGVVLIDNIKKNILFFKYSFYIFFLYIFIYNLSFIFGIETFKNYILINSKNVLDTQNIFILFFSFYSLIKIRNFGLNKIIANLYILNLIFFCLFKSDLYLVISVVVLYMYFFVFFEKKNIHLIFVPVLIFTIYINSGKFLNFYDSYISSYSFYISNTFVNFENLFFGFNNSNELYEVKTSKNFYLDFIYNFGLLALIPFLNLIFYTIKKIRFQKSGYINNDMIFFIFFIFILPFLTLSLGDIFVGSIVYLYWSTLLNSNQL